MPSLEVDNYGVPAVTTFVSFFKEALEVAGSVKPETTIEPALEEFDLEDVIRRIPTIPESFESQNGAGTRQKNSQRFAMIETAARGLLSNLIAETSINSPDFVKVWNFFDILTFLSDRGQCDPALLVWFVEELLDSQTIPGCRKIFDYLESRRKRIISKNFNDKKLVILRSCNELLRRLSRAEDTTFSGRVFIFLFQSFPLGDKSSVNLRGEYHIQNVTTWDQDTTKTDDTPEKMDIDPPASSAKEGGDQQSHAKAVSFEKKDTLDADALYPVFWSLQNSFNQPKSLFDPVQFSQFKSGLEATVAAFKANETNHDTKASKHIDEAKRGTKRKRESEDEEFVSAFNPKYLTSRDLFELEISDLSFRRYVLVQALIIMEFLLSLSPKSKEKLASVQQLNKSVAYVNQTLSEEDTKWVEGMKFTIATYLKQGHDGQFFFRMVETVLSRDKNWVRWKIENCAPIERPAVSPETYADAMKAAKVNATNKRLRPQALGSLSLNFLNEGDDATAMEKLKASERYRLPELASLRRKIQDDAFEVDMSNDAQSKADAIERKASKTWRALRIASRSRLALFDKIDSWENIDVLFEDKAKKQEEEVANGNAAEAMEVEEAVVGENGTAATEEDDSSTTRENGISVPQENGAILSQEMKVEVEAS